MKLSNWRQLKIRGDLIVSPQSHHGELYYVIKDPVTLRYFRLRSTEYAILKMLDGETSVDEISGRLQQLGHSILQEELQVFLRQLGAANFFENVLPNQADTLYQMAALRRSRKSLWSQAKRILYIRVALVDPDRAFTAVMRHIGFLWSRWAMTAYVVLFLVALCVFFSHYDEAAARFSGLISPESLFAFWVIFIVEKFFHELGHGFTCKRFGGEVHDMGALILVLTPCMYCNISDAWILEKPSRKFWISAAGIVTEVIIASLATLVWWATGPGTVNSIAYRVMILAGISSVLVNGNPLMKWDGYYILSDILGMPNLRENSVRYVIHFFRKYVLGLPSAVISRFDREGFIKLVYGFFSSLWIFYVMYRITKGMLVNFPALGVWVLISTVYGVVLIPLVRISAWISKHKTGFPSVDLRRLSAIAAAFALAGYFVFIHDMGYRVSAPCMIEPVQRVTLKAPCDGILVEMPFGEGDTVGQGGVMARLENRQLGLDLRRLLVQKELFEIQADAARAAGRVVEVDSFKRAGSETQYLIDQTRRRLDSLTVRAPFAGTVISHNPRSLLGKLLLEGDVILDIGDLSRAKVTIAVEEKTLRFVADKAAATISLRAYPWRHFSGTVEFISGAPIAVLPNPLSARASGPVVIRPDMAANVPVVSTYEVNIVLPNPDGKLLVGMVGKARIESGSRRLFDIIYSAIRESLRRAFGILS